MPESEIVSSDAPCAPTDRRGFFKKLLAIVLGGISTLVPVAVGLTVFLDPLRRKFSGNAFVRVATLELLPNDAVPRKFSVVSSRVDAWNKFSNVPIGAVYLRRMADDKVEALNVVCPH